jgi:hypothetical protein
VLSNTEIMSRTDEMFDLRLKATSYTEKYSRPSLADVTAFDTIMDIIKEQEELGEEREYVFNADIYSIWGDILNSNIVFGLDYGIEQVNEEIQQWLIDSGNMSFIEDLEEEDLDA